MTENSKDYVPSSPDESAYLDGYDTSAFPAFAVTTDVVMLTIRDKTVPKTVNAKGLVPALHVLLIQRGEHPYRGRWALPGGFVRADEDLAAAARRELVEETGVGGADVHLEQLGTYGAAGRDPRMRVVDVAYLALLPEHVAPTAGTDADDAHWWPVGDVTPGMLAFDHDQILADGVERARAKLEYTPVATAFLGDEFTLRDLQIVYEAVWGTELHRSNFRRKVRATKGFVVETDDESGHGHRGRPAKLYRAGQAVLLHPAVLRDK